MAAPDYLDDPYAGAAAVGSARAYGDLGYAAPRSGLADTAGYQSPLEAPPARAAAARAPTARATAFKPADPLDDPDYKRAALARKELHDNEQFATQRLRDFDANEGKQLFAQQKALDVAHKTLAATDQSNLGAAALNAHPRPANYRALTQTRQRLADEAARIRTTRQAFDDTTFMPMRNRLMSGAGRQQQDDTPPANDVLQQRDGFWTTRGPRATDLRVGPAEPSPAPGSVGAGNFTQPEATAPTNGSGTPDLTPQNNPPGDEARGEIEARAPAEAPTAVDSGAKGGLRQVFGPAADALDDGALADRRQAMASDLKAKWGGGSVADRVKMIFGRDGYGQNEPEMPEQMIGSEAAGTKGSLYTIPKMQGTGVGAGIVNAANKFSSGMTTAENAALMAATGGAGALAELGGATAIGRAAQAAKAVAIGGFTAQMASGLPESVRNAYRVYHDPKSTDAEKAEALATPGFEAAMTALAAHGAVGEGRMIGDRARGESAPTYNKEPNFVGDLDLNRARLDTANAKLAEANQRIRGVLDRGAGPQIGPDVETLPTGESPNAPEIKGPAALDVRQPPGDGEAVGSGNTVDQAPAGTREEVPAGPGEGLSGGGGEAPVGDDALKAERNHRIAAVQQARGWLEMAKQYGDKAHVEAAEQKVREAEDRLDEVGGQFGNTHDVGPLAGKSPEAILSAAQQPSATESNEREPRPEEPVNPRGIDPGQRVEPPGTVRDQPLRSDVGGAGEQPRGSEGERPAPGQGGDAAPDADERHAGDAGQPVLQPAAAQQRGDAAGSSPAPARGSEGNLGGGGERGPGLAGEGGGRDAGAVEPKGILVGSDLDAWAQRFLKERGGQANSLFDPQQLAAIAIRSGAIFEKGIRDKAAWSAEVVRQFGEKVRDHLEPIWDQMHAFLKDPSVARKLIQQGGEKWQAGVTAPIGIKNASVDEQRAQLGLPPSEERHGTTQAEAHAAAIARIAADKDAGTKLVDQLHASPRAPDATENLILDAELVARRKAVAAAEKRWQAAASAGDKEAMESASHEATEAQAAYTKAMDVSTAVGTKSSDSLNMRKAMLKEDFSLAELTRKQERLNRGKPVTEEQKATIRKEHEDFESTKADYEKKLAESEQKRAEAEADLALQKLTTKVAWERKGPPQPRGTILKTYVDHERAAGEAAMARIKARIASGKVGLNPIADPELIKDWVAVGRHYLAEGVLKAHDLGEALIKGIGEHVRPYINEIVSKSIKEREEYLRGLSSGRDTPAERRSTVSTMKERVAEGDSIGDLGHYVNKIAEQHLRDGVKGREPLLDAVHATLKEVKPDITRRETMDALSGYGQLKPLNPDPIKAELRDIKGQAQQIAKLQDMQAGQGPLKTGVERRIPSDEERRLIKQVEEAKKRGGYDVTDPAKQLKTSLDATKTRLANQIKDLDFQISTGKKIVRDKTQAPTDAEADALRAKRDALKKEYDEMFKKPGLTDEQRIRLATASVTRAIADYEGRIKAGAYQKRTQGAAGPTNSALDALRARRDALREQLEDLRNQANPAKTPEERALQARKTYLANRTAKLTEQLAKDDFSKPPARPRLTDRALENAQAAHESVKQRVRQRMDAQERANRTWPQKGIDVIPQISRAWKLSHITISGKLAAAAAARVAHSVVREGVISGLRQIPGVKGVAARAPRFGTGFQLHTEIKAHTDGVMRAIRATGQYLQNKDPQERLLYGKTKPDRDFSGVLGRVLHASLKTPAMMTEFERSYQKNAEFDAKRGVDPTDPVIKMKNGIAALKDADRAIFLQNSAIAGAWRAGLEFLRNFKVAGKPSDALRAAAAIAEAEAPIVTVPTNILGEVLEHIHGAGSGGWVLLKAHRAGLDKLPPEAADEIMRKLANGSMGLALIYAGWYLYKDIGPFHQPHEKKRPDSIPPEGAMRVGGAEIPKLALHNPATSVMQIAATTHHLMDGFAHKNGESDDFGWAAVKSLLGAAESQPFVRDTVDIGRMIEDPHGTLPREIGNQLVPGASQDLARMFDKDSAGNPIQRKPDGVLDNVKMNIPGLRQTVPTAPPPKIPQGRRQGIRDYLSEPRRR